MIAVSVSADDERAGFCDWVASDFGRECNATAAYVPYLPDPLNDLTPPPVSALIELEPADAPAAVAQLKATGKATVAIFEVKAITRKHAMNREPGQVTPGASLLALWTAKPEVDDSEVVCLWAKHAPLAIRVHHGAQRYVQNYILSREGPSKPYRGIALLHCPVAEGMSTGLYRNESEMALIAEDLASFLAEFDRFVAREYVYRLPERGS
jgi:hypothetical protein